MLQPSLAAYEQERVTGHAAPRGLPGRRAAPRAAGPLLQGLPDVLPACARGPRARGARAGDLSRDVLDTQGEQVTHALRVRVFPYAENVCAVWVMLAVHYKKAT